MAISIIGVSDTNPPSETNTSWVQIDSIGGGGGGGGLLPTILYERTSSLTLPSSTVDNTYVSIETTGTTIVPVTLFNATSSNVGRRVTIMNSRSTNEGQVTINFATGDNVENLFADNIQLLAGQSTTLIVRDDNLWNIVANSETELTPNFPSNPNNDDNTFMFAVNGDSSTTWNRDRNTTINLNRTTGSRQSYEVANPTTSGITVSDGQGYVFRNIGSLSWYAFGFATSNTITVDGVTYTYDGSVSSAYELLPNRTLILVWDSTDSRWEGKTLNFLTPLMSGAGGQSGMEAGAAGLTGRKIDIIAKNGEGSNLTHGKVVGMLGQDGAQEFVSGDVSNPPKGVLIGDTNDGDEGFVRTIGVIENSIIYDLSGNPINTVITNNTQLYLRMVFGQESTVVNNSDSGNNTPWGIVTGNTVTPIEGGGQTVTHDYFFDIEQYNQVAISEQLSIVMANVGNNTANISSLENETVISVTINNTYNLGNANAHSNVVYSMQGTNSGEKIITIGDLTYWNLIGQQSATFSIKNKFSSRYIKIVNSSGNFSGMPTDTMWLKPNELRDFRIIKDGSNYTLDVVGKVFYKFSYEKGLLIGGVWVNQNDLPTELLAPSSQQLVFKEDCKIEDLRLDMRFSFNGTVAPTFNDLISLHPSASINKNGTIVYSGGDVYLNNLLTSRSQYILESELVNMASNDYLTINGSDLTDVVGTTLYLRGEIVLKD